MTLAGTSTPVATYSDVGLTTPNANPVILDSSGRATIYLTPGTSYKFALTDSSNGTIWTQDNVLAVPASAATVDTTETAGEALTAGLVVYLSDGSGGKTQGQVYKADSANTYSSTTPLIGMVPAAVASGSSGTFRTNGQVTGLAGLTVGTDYYVGTAGALTAVRQTNNRYVGRADSTSSLILQANPPPPFSTGPTNNLLILGAGPGVPLTTVAAGTTLQFLAGVTGAAPSFRVLAGADLTSAAAVRVLDRLVTLTTLVSSVAETTMYSFSVPGGTLSTNKALRITLLGDYLNNSAGNDAFTLKVKYGATTVESWVASISNGAGANRRSLQLQAVLSAANATGAQTSYARAAIGNNAGSSATGTMAVANSDNGQPVEGTNTGIAEDSTAAKTLAITFQLGTSAVTVAARVYAVFLELLE